MQTLYLISFVIGMACAVPATFPVDEIGLVIDFKSVTEDRVPKAQSYQRLAKREISAETLPKESLSRQAIVANNQTVDSVVDDRGILSNLLGLPNTPDVCYLTNCNFIGLDLYLVVNIPSQIVCGNQLCGGDDQCTHFYHVPNVNGGTCYLKKAPGTGSAWRTPSPGTTCGHIPHRSCGSGSLVSLCLGLDLNIL